MKLAHISDLHLGIRICEVKMLDEQSHILKETVKILKKEKPELLLICGDIYDRPVPPEEAVELLNDFLSEVNRLEIKILMISGNHDSPQRIDFANTLLESAGVYVSGKYDGKIRKITKKDEYGEINFYLLPYIKPSYVNFYLPENEKIGDDFEKAVHAAIMTNPPDTKKRNIILAHQFVQGATRSDSEEVLVGFSDSISAEVFKDFDYVALGHLHKTQHIVKETVRYCGTPLKYAFTEEKNIKSITFVDVKEKGNISIYTKQLIAKRDVRNIKGSFKELMTGNTDDYIRAVLTDDTPVPNAFNRLRESYPNILKLEYDKKFYSSSSLKENIEYESKSTYELFEDFFEKVNNKSMKKSQKKILKELILQVEDNVK